MFDEGETNNMLKHVEIKPLEENVQCPDSQFATSMVYTSRCYGPQTMPPC